jgi:tight adherence protein B
VTGALAPGSGWGVASLIAGGLSLFLLLFAVLDAIFGRTPAQRRLAALKVFTHGDRTDRTTTAGRLLATAGDWVERSPALTRVAARSQPLLDQLGSAPRPPEWLAVRIAAALVLGLLLAAVVPVAGLPLGLLAGFLVPPAVLRSRVSRRRARFADDLPGILQLMLSSLRSGFTLQQAVEASVHDDEGPVAEELSRALSESRINGEFEDALHRVGERVRSQEMVWLVMALRLQREVGGSLADVMQTTADTMRERAYLRRHVRTLSAEGRISAYVLGALPVLVGTALFVIQPEYVRPLYTEFAGIAMLCAALVLLLVGTLWLRAMTKIEV